MENVKCCDCGLPNFFKCKNCEKWNVHYIKNWLLSEREYYICSFCKIETKIPDDHKIKIEQIKLL